MAADRAFLHFFIILYYNYSQNINNKMVGKCKSGDFMVIPAVDIMGGRCVQLVGGKPETSKSYGDPVEIALLWESLGAKALHIVDLDATLGRGENREVVKEISETINVPLQFGGGLRDSESVAKALGLGVSRVVLGTMAVKDPQGVQSLSEKFGPEKIIVAVDSSKGMITVNGWQKKTNMSTITLIRRFEDLVFGFLLTDVDKEGRRQGIDSEEFGNISRETDARIIASGGVSTDEDIQKLKELGLYGCVVGKALYEGNLDSSRIFPKQP